MVLRLDGPRRRRRRHGGLAKMLRALLWLVALQARQNQQLLDERRPYMNPMPSPWMESPPQLPPPRPRVSWAQWLDDLRAKAAALGMLVVMLAIGCIVVLGVVIAVGLWLQKPAEKAKGGPERPPERKVVTVDPQALAAADVLRGFATRIKAIQQGIDRSRAELSALEGAREANDGIAQAILAKNDRAGEGDSAREAAAKQLEAEADAIASGEGQTLPTASLIVQARATEQAARKLARQLERDVAYVRAAYEKHLRWQQLQRDGAAERRRP